jgi:polysaccharide biosynthesis/export protein
LNYSWPKMALQEFARGPAATFPALTRDFNIRGLLSAVTVLFVTVSLCPGPCLAQEKEETVQQANEKIQQAAAASHPKLLDTTVGAGDLLHIDVFDVPELTRDVRVSQLGDISFPLIPGKISVAGMTTFQIEAKLEQLLLENGLVSHPQVSVLIREQNSQPVSVVGAVARPMVYQLLRPTTLLELLAQAGGITDNAGSVILVTRSTGPIASQPPAGPPSPNAAPDTQTMTIRLQDLLESGDPSYNIQVLGGDIVSVPPSGIVYVMGGGIKQPGGYVLQTHGAQITVLRAVALAHGTSGFAKADDAVILRTNPLTGQKDQIPVHLKQIEQRKIEDIPMQTNDILYIPDSAGLKALAKGAEAAISIGSALAIYRVGT